MTLTVTPAHQVSRTGHTWALARGLPASGAADTVCVADAADEEDVTKHAGQRGQGGDGMGEAGHWSSGTACKHSDRRTRWADRQARPP